MVIIRTLIALIEAILRSAASALLLLFSTMLSAALVLGVVVFTAIGLTGTISLGLFRGGRRRPK